LEEQEAGDGIQCGSDMSEDQVFVKRKGVWRGQADLLMVGKKEIKVPEKFSGE